MKKYQKWITVGVIAFLAALGVVTGYFLQQQKVNKERSLIFIPKTEGAAMISGHL